MAIYLLDNAQAAEQSYRKKPGMVIVTKNIFKYARREIEKLILIIAFGVFDNRPKRGGRYAAISANVCSGIHELRSDACPKNDIHHWKVNP